MPIRFTGADSEQTETKIEYQVTTEIEWMALYWKKSSGTRISMMDFNSIAGQSKRKMKDVKLFTANKEIYNVLIKLISLVF